jgi:hypothetical protein
MTTYSDPEDEITGTEDMNRTEALERAAQALREADRRAASLHPEDVAQHVSRAQAWMNLADLLTDEDEEED